MLHLLSVFVSGFIQKGHALVIAVDGALLQPDLVHAVSGGGGLCLMRLCLLHYKNPSRLARRDEVNDFVEC